MHEAPKAAYTVFDVLTGIDDDFNLRVTPERRQWRLGMGSRL